MKKTLLLAALCAGAVFALTGCTSVESTQRYNGLGLADRSDKAVCHTFVEVPCYFFWGIPIFGGSKESGKTSIFQDNATNENVVLLLTREIRSRNGARVINLQTSVAEYPVMLGLFTKRIMQASGTGVRTRAEAMDQAAAQFEQQIAPGF